MWNRLGRTRQPRARMVVMATDTQIRHAHWPYDFMNSYLGIILLNTESIVCDEAEF